MSSEGGAEATAVPVRIHEHLALAAAPAAVHPYGVGATRSPHTLLQRGLDSPALRPEGDPEPGTGRRAVTLDSELRPAGPLRIPGRVDGVEGILDGSSGDWFFVPTDPADEITGGTFTSSLAEIAEGSRQVLWMGKNNIRDVEAVLEHTARMAEAAGDGDTLVLGHWCTENDPIGSETGAAVAEVNSPYAESYGDHFLYLQQLLTCDEGLASCRSPLSLLEQSTTHDALTARSCRRCWSPRRDPPQRLGNLALSWALDGCRSCDGSETTCGAAPAPRSARCARRPCRRRPPATPVPAPAPAPHRPPLLRGLPSTPRPHWRPLPRTLLLAGLRRGGRGIAGAGVLAARTPGPATSPFSGCGRRRAALEAMIWADDAGSCPRAAAPSPDAAVTRGRTAAALPFAGTPAVPSDMPVLIVDLGEDAAQASALLWLHGRGAVAMPSSRCIRGIPRPAPAPRSSRRCGPRSRGRRGLDLRAEVDGGLPLDVAWLSRAGMVPQLEGDWDGEAGVTRAELATVLHRADGVIAAALESIA